MPFCEKCGREIPEGTLCDTCAAEPVATAAAVSAANTANSDGQAAPAAPTAPYFQPNYQAPRPTQPYIPPQQAFRIPLTQQQLPPEYKPLGAWVYFLYSLLFSLPLIGFICLLIFSLGGTDNINLRNFARSHFCSYLIGLILIVLIVALFLILGLTAGDVLPDFGDLVNNYRNLY